MKAAKLLEFIPSVTEEDAKLACRLMRVSDPYTVIEANPDKLKKTLTWVGSCHNLPGSDELVMQALDELLGMCGVEPIRTEEWIDPYYGDIRAVYLNTGDTYAGTIVLDHKKCRYMLTTYGDYVESLGDIGVC